MYLGALIFCLSKKSANQRNFKLLKIITPVALVLSFVFTAKTKAQTSDQDPPPVSSDVSKILGNKSSDSPTHPHQEVQPGIFWDHNYVPTPPDDKAEVVFFRSDLLYGISVDLKIMEGRDLILTVNPNSSHYHIFEPGKHTFYALGSGIGWMKPGTPLTLNLVAGNIYFVTGEFYSNFWGPATPVLREF